MNNFFKTLEAKLLLVVLFAGILLIYAVLKAPTLPDIWHGTIVDASPAITKPIVNPEESESSVNSYPKKVQKTVKVLVDNFNVPLSRAKKIVSVAYTEAKSKGLDFPLVMSVMAHESKFKPKAIGNGVDFGLMQVNIDAHHDVVQKLGGEYALLDIPTNIKVGTDILKRCENSQESRTMVLRCYNGLSPASRPYPDKVLQYYPLFS